MKNSPSSKILVATVVALAALLLAGCRREKMAQAEGAPAENSRMAAVDSTKKGIELIRRDGRGMQSDSERVREKYDWLKKKVEEAMAINKAMLDEFNDIEH